MHTATMNDAPDDSADTKGRYTGRTVLYWLIGFFAVIIAVNAVFLWFALSSFSGIEATSAYKAGMNFSREKAFADAQTRRGWQVTADITRSGKGADIHIVARDKQDAPIRDVAFTATFKRPAQDRYDVAVVLTQSEPGIYTGRMEDLAPGQWHVVMEAAGVDGQSGEPVRLFVSESRVFLKD